MTQSDDAKLRIHEMARDELSMTSRLGYVALALVAAAMTTVILTLWMTEPGLPGRAQVAFAVLSAIGISWLGLATWALTTRKPLAARDRVIAGWMAVVFTSVFLAGMVLFACVIRSVQGMYPVITGFVLLAFAIRALRRARLRFEALSSRRAELERLLAAHES